MKHLARGFSLPSAIFVLVVLAFLGVAMATFFNTQQQTAAMDVMGARAYQAARAGIEWGAFQVSTQSAGAFATSCRNAPPVTQTLPAGTLAGTLAVFDITITCSATTHNDGGTTVTMYHLTSLATYGAAGTPDRIERQLQASMAPL